MINAPLLLSPKVGPFFIAASRCLPVSNAPALVPPAKALRFSIAQLLIVEVKAGLGMIGIKVRLVADGGGTSANVYPRLLWRQQTESSAGLGENIKEMLGIRDEGIKCWIVTVRR